MDVATVKREAVTRVLARRRPPRIRSYTDPVSAEQVKAEDRTVGGDELLPATVLAEWADERLARLQGGGPVTEALAVILAAAREGERAAVAAVAAAARLGAWDQFGLYNTVSMLPARLPDAQRLVAAVQGEWRRLGLQTTAPDAMTTPHPRGPRIGPAVDAPPGEAYSPSVPMEMRAPWLR